MRTFLDKAAGPQTSVPGEIIVAGDEADPFLARAIDIAYLDRLP